MTKSQWSIVNEARLHLNKAFVAFKKDNYPQAQTDVALAFAILGTYFEASENDSRNS